MAANPFDARLEIRSVNDILPENERRDEILENMPGGPGRLIVIARVTGGDTFAITCQPIGLQGDKHALTIRLAPKGGFERRDERHGKMMESDGVDFHGFPTE